jgi:penicillin-binding protein 2A
MTQTDTNNGKTMRGKGRAPTKSKGKRPRKGKKKIVLIWLFFMALFAIVCAVVGYLLIILNGEKILNSNIDKLNLAQSTIVVDRSGNEVGKLAVSGVNREYVQFGDIPKLVQDAFVATEDKRFYEHNGVDLLGIGRALVKDVIARSAVEGASTITQQLAKNLFLNADKTVFRKGTEASIALALEHAKSKQEILELYLNRIYFGKGQYGIKTAAEYYFNVSDLNKLKLWQIATLAGIPKAPNTYNPVSNPEKSMERRGVVLQLMLDQGLITAEEEAAAAKQPFDPNIMPKQDSKYLTYLDYVVDEAKKVTGKTEDELLSKGYTIKTTINTKAQSAMETAFAKDSMFEKSKDETKVQGAMVIMDQHDGSLIAMIGGRDYEKQGLNRVVVPRQPGSSFKPISAYGPALETGNFYPWSIVQDVKKCFGSYCPSNSNKIQYKGEIPMRDAIKESRNVSAVWLLNEIGVSKGFAFANNLGIKLGNEDRNLSMALGGLTNGVTPLQMVRAYGSFANGGQLQDPHSILSITDSTGAIIYEYKAPKAKQVMNEDTAYYVTDLLEGVLTPGGTGVRAKFGSRPIAGKTGTTQAAIPNFKTSGNRDVWFVGYTPEWTAAVWYGYDKTDKNHYLKESSGQAAAMFAAVMSKGLEGVKQQAFPKPANVKEESKLAQVTGLMAAYDPVSVSVALNWTAAVGDGLTYRVYRKEASEADFRMIAEVADPAYDDLALLPDQSYTYYVTAYQATNKQESVASDQLTVNVTSGLEVVPPPIDGGEVPPPDTSVTPSESPSPPVDGQIPSDSPSPSPFVLPSPDESSPPPDAGALASPSPDPSPSP